MRDFSTFFRSPDCKILLPWDDKPGDPMKSTLKLFMVLITVTVFVIAWITQQLGKPGIQLLIALLVAASLAAFLVMNLLDQREQRRQRRERESPAQGKSPHEAAGQKRSGESFSLRERKSGLTWGGGNIKASEAKRGTKRKFLGR